MSRPTSERSARGLWRHAFAGAGLAGALLLPPGGLRAAPLVPTSDKQIVEVLPQKSAVLSQERSLQRRLQIAPRDSAAAVALAGHYLEQARALGDARFAGRALGVLQPWSDAASAPVPLLLMTATIQQHLHAFDAATAGLETLLARDPLNAQAWLTLATVRRVQGRYGASEAACGQIAAIGQRLVAQACSAENLGLQGDGARAGELLRQMLAGEALDAGTRNWLLVSLAELEWRQGGSQRALSLMREALRLAPDDSYTRLALADLLLDQGQAAQALAVTEPMARSDAVVVRRAIAARRAGMAIVAGKEAAEFTARLAQSEERRRLLPAREAQAVSHAREQAMFALWVQDQPARAVALARKNLTVQREPLDLLLMARAARAAADAGALQEVRQLQIDMGLHDARLDQPV